MPTVLTREVAVRRLGPEIPVENKDEWRTRRSLALPAALWPAIGASISYPAEFVRRVGDGESSICYRAPAWMPP